jgi:hypothetical protein
VTNLCRYLGCSRLYLWQASVCLSVDQLWLAFKRSCNVLEVFHHFTVGRCSVIAGCPSTARVQTKHVWEFRDKYARKETVRRQETMTKTVSQSPCSVRCEFGYPSSCGSPVLRYIVLRRRTVEQVQRNLLIQTTSMLAMLPTPPK